MRRFRLAALAAAVLAALPARAQIDPTIPLRVQPPRVQSPLDALQRVQELRNLQLQNEQLRLEAERWRIENEARQKQLNSVAQVPAAAQPEKSSSGPDTLTHGLTNCRLWRGASTTVKVAYIVGAIELLTAASVEMFPSTEEAVKAFRKFMPYELTGEESSASVDRICAEPENSAIPVRSALRIASLKAMGATPKEIEEQLSSERKFATMSFDSDRKK